MTGNGVHGASNDDAKVRSYFDGPNRVANLGIACGERSGIIVIDIDDETALQRLESENGSLPKTWTVRTGRPTGGRHLYFRYEDRFRDVTNKADFVPGLDCRTNGGYVLAPPSLHASGKRYEWLVAPEDCELATMPEWLVKLLPRREPKTQRIEKAKTTAERLVAYLDRCPPAISGKGGHNVTFGTACRIVELFGDEFDDEKLLDGLQAWNERCEPPWTESELRRKIDHARAKTGSNPIEATEVAEADPLTLHADALHGLVGEIVQANDPHTEADPAGVLLSLLVAFGSAVGNNPRFRVGHETHGGNLFVALVGDTASGKGQSWNVAKALTKIADPEWDSVCIAHGLASGEGLVERLADPECGSDIIGVPPAQRLLCVETEFARPIAAMHRDNSTLSPILRSAWDSQTLEVLTRKTKLRASNAHVSFIGHVTEPELKRLFGSGVETSNGFANRFLWAIVRSEKSLPFGGDPQVLLSFADRFRNSLSKAKTIGEVRRSKDADRLWSSEYESLKRSTIKATERGRPIVCRIALIYALIDGSETIDVPHLKAALAVWRYCEASAYRIFGNGDGDGSAGRSESLGAKVKRTYRQRPGILRSELCAIVDRNKTKADYDAVFASQIASGELFIIPVHEACRPAERLYPGPIPQPQPQDRTDESETEPEYELVNEDGTPYRSEERKPEPKTQSHFVETGTASLSDLIEWRNRHGVVFHRRDDGTVWPTAETQRYVSPEIEAAIYDHQATLSGLVPTPKDGSRSLDADEFLAELLSE